MDVVTSLDENIVSRALAFIRMDSDHRLDHDKWCAIMKTRGDSSTVKEFGALLVREKHITSPIRRSRVTTRGKTSIKADEGNIRFFERQVNERSPSTDRPPLTPTIGRHHHARNQSPYSLPPAHSLSGDPITRTVTSAKKVPRSLVMSPLPSPNIPNPIGLKAANLSPERQKSSTSNQKITPCVHFSRGECRDGDQCRFEHRVSALLEKLPEADVQK